MTPSTYQQNILDWIRNGSGNAVVDAVAGSGKTSTLVMIAQLIAREDLGDGMFLAFNKHISKELSEKLPGMDVRTIHSLGMAALRKAGHRCELRNDKYTEMARRAVEGDRRIERADRQSAIESIRDLCNMARLTLADATDRDVLAPLAAEYDIDASNWTVVSSIVPRLLEEGARDRVTIDFADMVWLPVRCDLPVRQADWVLVDEAQDLNACQLELTLRARRADGRMIYVGDRRQAIYSFAGADARSIQTITARTAAATLPLSICYRCPAAHVAMAAAIWPGIEAAPDAPAGEVERNLDEDALVARARVRDLVICRTTAPAVAVCYRLIRSGKAARVRGRDIGVGLVSLLKRVEKRADYRWADLRGCLYDHMAREIEAAEQRRDQDAVALLAGALQDKVDTIMAVHDASNPRSMEELKDHILALFADTDGQGVIWLSSIHRAKGLEADRVWIMRPDLLPHPMSRSAAAREQERNLEYIAYTRARHALYIIDQH